MLAAIRSTEAFVYWLALVVILLAWYIQVAVLAIRRGEDGWAAAKSAARSWKTALILAFLTTASIRAFVSGS